MGEINPMMIIGLARQMIELSGRVPGVDIIIKIVGQRPGEMKIEQLIDENEFAVDCISGVTEIRSPIR